MADASENLTQDKKIDKLQYQMESVLLALEKVDSRLEAMQKGYVAREEYQEFKKFVGTLATQKDLNTSNKEIEKLQEWNTWAVRIVLTAVILAVLGTVIVTQ